MRPFHDFRRSVEVLFFHSNHFGISVASTIRNWERGSALFS
jgi:hypothetical protein